MKRLIENLERRSAVLLLLMLLGIFGLIDSNTFLNPANIENVSRQISLDAPMVFGQTLVLIAGGIDISVGATMAMSASLAIGLQSYGIPTAVAGALFFGLAVGLLNGLLVTRGRIVPFVATLGTMSVVNGVLLTYTGQLSLVGKSDKFAWWGGGQIGVVPVPLSIILVLLALLWIFLEYTRQGRGLYAIGGSSEAAFLGGISVKRTQVLAFVLCGAMAGVSGILVASRLNSASVQLGGDSALMSISAALIGGASLLGGKGSIVSAFFGVMALGVLNNGMNLLGVPTYHQIAIRALILVTIVAVDALANGLRRRNLIASRIAQ